MIDQEQIRMARKVNLVTYLINKGYKLKREPGNGGNCRLVGHQGLIVQENHFFRFGGGGEKGNAIDFLVQIEGKTFQQAVQELLGIGCTTDLKNNIQDKQRKDFELPAAAANRNRVKAYLSQTRGIPEQIIKELIQEGLVYQDLKGNCVFPCRDKMGQARGAILRGTTNMRWIGVAEGSDVSFPWVLKLQEGDSVVITESPIDGMSLLALYPQTSGYIIGMGGLREKSILRFLAEYPEVKNIVLATDNDQAGRDFAQEQAEKLAAKYVVAILRPPEKKDWNDFLFSAPQN